MGVVCKRENFIIWSSGSGNAIAARKSELLPGLKMPQDTYLLEGRGMKG